MIPKTIQETRSHILDGKLTLSEIVEHYFRQISEKNAEINAFVYQDRDDALAQATRIQKNCFWRAWSIIGCNHGYQRRNL